MLAASESLKISGTLGSFGVSEYEDANSEAIFDVHVLLDDVA